MEFLPENFQECFANFTMMSKEELDLDLELEKLRKECEQAVKSAKEIEAVFDLFRDKWLSLTYNEIDKKGDYIVFRLRNAVAKSNFSARDCNETIFYDWLEFIPENFEELSDNDKLVIWGNIPFTFFSDDSVTLSESIREVYYIPKIKDLEARLNVFQMAREEERKAQVEKYKKSTQIKVSGIETTKPEQLPEHLYAEETDKKIVTIDDLPDVVVPKQPTKKKFTSRVAETIDLPDYQKRLALMKEIEELNESIQEINNQIEKAPSIKKAYTFNTDPSKVQFPGIDDVGCNVDYSEFDQALALMRDLNEVTVEEGVIDYVTPWYYNYLDPIDKSKEVRKMNIINDRRRALGLPPTLGGQVLTPPTDLEKRVYQAPGIPEQEKAIDLSYVQKISLNVMAYPIIHRFREGKLFTTVNLLDRYVNVSKLLKYAHDHGYSSTKNPKDINAWLKTRHAQLLMVAGEDRFKRGIPHPYTGKIYKEGIRMGYRITRRMVYDEVYNPDDHKGVYLHPRIAEYVALWVSDEFHWLFANEFEDCISEYYELKDLDKEIDPLYWTPILPTSVQIAFYRRYGKSNINYSNGLVKISVGPKHYIDKICKDPNNITLYRVRAVKDPKLFLKRVKANIPFALVHSNLYTFGDEEIVTNLVGYLSKIDGIPPHLADIWQDSIFNLEALGERNKEIDDYETEKMIEFRNSFYGVVPKVQQTTGYWVDENTFEEIIAGKVVQWRMNKPDIFDIKPSALTMGYKRYGEN